MNYLVNVTIVETFTMEIQADSMAKAKDDAAVMVNSREAEPVYTKQEVSAMELKDVIETIDMKGLH